MKTELIPSKILNGCCGSATAGRRSNASAYTSCSRSSASSSVRPAACRRAKDRGFSLLQGKVNPFSGKIAVIAGGGSGIGRSICVYLAEHGANVVADRNLEGAQETGSATASRGGSAKVVRADVDKAEEVESLHNAPASGAKRRAFESHIARSSSYQVHISVFQE